MREVDKLRAGEVAAEQERLLVGLIHLTGKILHNVDAETSAAIIKKQDLIKELFREFLFAAHYQAE